ncbi:MAG: hypothetical protein NZ954_08435 [Thermofilaceae archaeon]|nr:hypothetical protein [Thermofilaceae archaeon]
MAAEMELKKEEEEIDLTLQFTDDTFDDVFDFDNTIRRIKDEISKFDILFKYDFDTDLDSIECFLRETFGSIQVGFIGKIAIVYYLDIAWRKNEQLLRLEVYRRRLHGIVELRSRYAELDLDENDKPALSFRTPRCYVDIAVVVELIPLIEEAQFFNIQWLGRRVSIIPLFRLHNDVYIALVISVPCCP